MVHSKLCNFVDPLKSRILAYYVLPQTLRVEEVRKIRRKKGERWQSTAKKFSSCYFTPVILFYGKIRHAIWVDKRILTNGQVLAPYAQKGQNLYEVVSNLWLKS